MNKVVLVTGASRGIGAATAKLLATQGYSVVINYRVNRAEAEKVLQDVRNTGAEGILIQADVSDEHQVIEMFKLVAQQLGPVTHLVNNAGILKQQASLLDLDADRINQILTTNVTSYLLCAREAVEQMVSGGAIVNVSSMAAKTGSPHEYIDYAASKGAIDTVTIGLAKELASQKIRVNGVRPGVIYTDMHADGGEPNRPDRVGKRLPLQRGGTAEEVANAIAWLLSEQSSFSTGTFIDVSGGL
ncbi:SDR family oxidoreductase [Vibrio sp. S4M6]|uniref:SDR family oxidoreductase n=1 Tax=Vibrio sinus TaxID=2946865 RepID=UPI00202A139B|nr:SDR family oxidoreductase [Vibrio sinus]MCL9783053.1 SDR family oxidoreductase [Vibrio sinus]